MSKLLATLRFDVPLEIGPVAMGPREPGSDGAAEDIQEYLSLPRSIKK